MFHESDVMRLHAAGQPDRQQAVGHVDALGATEVQSLGEEVEDLLDIRAVEQRVIEAARPHAMGFEIPDVGIVDARLGIGLVGMGEKFDAVARGDREADAAADARHFAGGDMIDLEAVVGDALLELVEVGVLEHLERHQIEARRVGAAQHEGMMVEFVGGLQIDAAIGAFGHLVQADALGVVLDRRGHVEHAELDEARAKNA